MRRFADVTTDQYFSPDHLSNYVADLANQIDAVRIDPAVGDGAIFHKLKQPRVGFEIDPSLPGITKDFLTVTSQDLPPGPKCVVMNPPFSLPGRKNGVIHFVNHCVTCLEDKSHIITVAPQSMRKWSNIMKLHPTIHLTHETVFKTPVKFKRGAKTVSIRVVVQTYQIIHDTHRRQPTLLNKHPMFRISATNPENASFFMKRMGSLKRLGAVAKGYQIKDGRKTTEVGVLPGKYTMAQATGVHATDDSVFEKMQSLYSSGVWERVYADSCAGNNPTMSNAFVYTVFEFGEAYLDKRTYGITVTFKP